MFTSTKRLPIDSGVKCVLTLLLMAYPVLVYVGLNHLDVRLLGLLLLGAVIARMAVMRQQSKRDMVLFLSVGVTVAMLVLIFDQAVFLRLYPVCISVLMLGIFGYSLRHPPTVVESIARRSFPEGMPEEVVAYTRNVTKIWCAFFLCNAAIAAYTVFFASLEAWTLYNGLISYIVMGLLFAGEYAVRIYKMKRKVRCE